MTEAKRLVSGMVLLIATVSQARAIGRADCLQALKDLKSSIHELAVLDLQAGADREKLFEVSSLRAERLGTLRSFFRNDRKTQALIDEANDVFYRAEIDAIPLSDAHGPQTLHDELTEKEQARNKNQSFGDDITLQLRCMAFPRR